MKGSVARAIEAHAAAGRRFAAGGVQSFVREQGEGPAVVCVHGVPSSSYVYRKVIPALADQGMRGIAFDFPGLGLAARPADFDYSWSGLARWMGAAIDALEVERCHLVVHDIGAPIGFEWAIRNPDRLHSLTALNCMVDVGGGFRRHWTMQPFAIPGSAELTLALMRPWPASQLFYVYGVADRAAVPRHEVMAYTYLLKRLDGGRAFSRIVRGFELTAEKQRFYFDGLGERGYPARIIWGERDPVLGIERLRAVQAALRVEEPVLLPAKHFLQEDQAPALAGAVADLVAPLG